MACSALPKLILVGKTSDVIGQFFKHLIPTLNRGADVRGFKVHDDVYLQDDGTKMHELGPTSPRGESSMDFNDSLDLTDASSFRSLARHHHGQPVSVDSGPHGLIEHLVTSSSTFTNSSQPIVPHGIQCKVIEIPYDNNITEVLLYHSLGREAVIVLMLDSSLADVSDGIMNTEGFDAECLAPYKDILDSVSAVSTLHGIHYKVMMAAFSQEHDAACSEKKNAFRVMWRCSENTHGLDYPIRSEELIINKPECINLLCDALRSASAGMEEGNDSNLTRTLFGGKSSNQTGDFGAGSMAGGKKENALIVLSLIADEINKMEIKGSVSSQIIRNALRKRPDLCQKMNAHLSDLVNMGCLIPCYSKGKINYESYMVHHIAKKPTSSFLSCPPKCTKSPMLRIQFDTDKRVHILPSILISRIVSECMNTCDLAKQGKHYQVYQNCVAFGTTGHSTRLLLSIENDCIFLVLFDYSECKAASSKAMNRRLCQKFREYVEKTIDNLYGRNIPLTHSIQCLETTGEFAREEGWMDVSEMKECNAVFHCSSHSERSHLHRVQLVDTLHVWYPGQIDTESGQAHAFPDTTVDSEIPDEALPDIANCFGQNWDLFFISQGIPNQCMGNISLICKTPDGKIHEALLLLKNHLGKLSIKGLRKLAKDDRKLNFNFDQYDKIVDKLKRESN